MGERLAIVLMGLCATVATAQITMDTHIQSTGAFSSRGGSSGIITNNIEYRSTIQLPLVVRDTAPVDPLSLREESTARWSGKALVLGLDSRNPGQRVAVLKEIARRRWSKKASALLTRRVSNCLKDEYWQVAAQAARTIARLGDPSGPAALVPILAYSDSDRVVAVLKALGQIGTLATLRPVQKQINRVDLSVSVAASVAAEAIRRRARP
jgi:hypothetical protein